jgi:phospholipid transport system transporter-binding protein
LAQITLQGNRWLVSGDITADHICDLLSESAALGNAQNVEIDLADVSDVDTASISLMFEWLRQAHASKHKVTFANLPKNLLSLATLYGVLELIPQTSH